MARQKRQLIGDWLKTPDKNRERISDWLAEPTPRRPSAPSPAPPPPPVPPPDPPPRSSAGEPGDPEQEPDPGRRWPLSSELTLAILVGVYAAWETHQSWSHQDQAWQIGLMVTALVWLGLRILMFIWKWRKPLLAVGVVTTTAVALALAEKPWCQTELDEVEGVLCLVLPVRELAPVPPEDSLIPISDVWGPPRWSDLVYYPSQPDLVPAVFENAFTGEEQVRFNQCLAELYKQPTLRFRDRIIRRYQLDPDIAYDLAIDSLLRVCAIHSASARRELDSYLATAVKNAVTDHFRGRQRLLYETSEQPSTCWSDWGVLLEGERYLWTDAWSRLSEAQSRVVRRWMEGGDWTAVGRDLGMTNKQAADHFKKAVDRMTDDVATARKATCEREEYERRIEAARQRRLELARERELERERQNEAYQQLLRARATGNLGYVVPSGEEDSEFVPRYEAPDYDEGEDD